ncbi:MAG: M23 family metallopeptidase [Selenomonadaceae bacterium]|nr:M23 family metallopeptidase [Selenomonadaceae bacterium]
MFGKNKIFMTLAFIFTLIFSSTTVFAGYPDVADNTVPAYHDENLTDRRNGERVDAGDRVTILRETANAYYMRYPVRNGTKDRWVPKSVFNRDDNVKQKLLNAVFGRSGGHISCDFDSYVNTPGRHEGIDMVLSNGAEIHAIASGTVTKAGGDRINTVAIYDSANDKTIVYLHMEPVSVSVGQYVNKGQVIGRQGSKGASSSHIHLEVRNGKRSAAAKSVNDPTLDNSNPYAYLGRIL